MAVIYELPEAEARALLEAKRYGHLGCVVDEEPYVVPINYVYADDRLYAHSLPGLKIDAMRSTRSACIQVEDLAAEYHWRSVQAFCRYVEI
jgi:nitroimidazol reductase NimA-like FMN-containing flavoprotein (pyridoxamine 5'-phosphate oxidase superfamily)